MAKLYRVAFIALCMCSLFSVMVGADGGTVVNPVTGTEPLLFTPAPEAKLPPDGCRIFCIGGFSTSVNGGDSDWGMGSSCAEAQAAFSNAVNGKAQSHCDSIDSLGVCNVTEVKGGCFFNGTMFQIDGYADYGCRQEICP